MGNRKGFITPDGRFTLAGKMFWARLAVIVPLVHGHLMIFGCKRTARTLRRLSAVRPGGAFEEPCNLDRFVWEVRRTVRRFRELYPFSGSCLSRSLAVWWLFRLQGLETSLHIGTRRFKGEFQAHAWVDYKLRHLNAGPLVTHRYKRFEHDFAS